MKKLLALALALVLVTFSAAADTLSLDLETATLDELQAAQSILSQRISKLRAAAAPAGETITLSGSGTSILSGVEVVQIPARVTIQGAVKVTLTGGKLDRTFNSWADEEGSCEVLTEAGTFDALVEGKGEWTLAIEPLKEGGTIELSGVGPYVSDFFPLSAATIVHVVMDASASDAWSASLYLHMGHQYSNIEAWDEELVTGDGLFSAPLKLEGDGIVKPVGDRTQYYWIVDVPAGAEWSITVK
ncbi:MAG: hypothetical protein GXY67_10715 [Clostridiales bacterium]|nr:hypothetical protein [Clostridiales bacterium]